MKIAKVTGKGVRRQASVRIDVARRITEVAVSDLLGCPTSSLRTIADGDLCKSQMLRRGGSPGRNLSYQPVSAGAESAKGNPYMNHRTTGWYS
jgi:hypothetical protein